MVSHACTITEAGAGCWCRFGVLAVAGEQWGESQVRAPVNTQTHGTESCEIWVLWWMCWLLVSSVVKAAGSSASRSLGNTGSPAVWLILVTPALLSCS